LRKRNQLTKTGILYCIQNIKFIICILASFTIGGIFAAVFAFTLPELSCKELLLYLEDFFRNMEHSGADSAALFRSGLLSNLKNFGFLFFFSVTVIGPPFIAAFAAVKGFMHCFTLFFMFRLYGVRAVAFFLLGMMPHYLLLIPCYGILCTVCLKFSLLLLHEKQELKKNISRLLLTLVCLFLLATMAVLLQAYIEPLLIRLISGLYVA